MNQILIGSYWYLNESTADEKTDYGEQQQQLWFNVIHICDVLPKCNILMDEVQ